MIFNLRSKWRNTTLGRSSRVLSRNDQKKILLVSAIQVLMGVLDLVGVALIGVLGALAVSGVESRKPGNRVHSVLELLSISNDTFRAQVLIIGICATVILVLRTCLSIFFTRRTLYFLSRRGAAISSRLVSKLLSKSLIEIQSRTIQETLYALTYGVGTITLGVLGTAVTIVSDTSILFVMFFGLLVVSPSIAISTVIVFALIGLALFKFMHQRASELGSKESQLSIKSNEQIYQVLSSYRESVVRNRRSYYASQIGKSRLLLADTMAELNFMPNVSKYVIETTVVLGALFISAIQFALSDAVHAVGTLSIFLAAGTRIAPAVLRLQQGAIQIRSSLSSAGPTLDLIESLGNADEIVPSDDVVHVSHSGFHADVELRAVSFSYPNAKSPAIYQASISLQQGLVYAVVGSSGAGKTTFVDLLLGVLEPESGTVKIAGYKPSEAVSKWPGAISYVPQDVIISNGTIRENVALGYPTSSASDELVWKAIKTAQLQEFVEGLPLGLDTPVGDRGTRMSGGQRQRLGIARAMFTQPKLLVLDEATSALDGETEANLSDAIHSLKGEVTVIMIAHRLSTVRNSDVVIYLDSGHIKAVGTFQEIRENVVDFDRQASLMGL